MAPYSQDDLAQEIVKEYNRKAQDRGTLDAHLTEIAERILPSHSKLFTQGPNSTTKGEKRNLELYDSTAMIALNRFSAIIDSLLTPRNQTWHKLASTNPDLNKNREIQLYFATVTRILFEQRYAPLANYSSQNQMVYKSMGAYGTGTLFIDDFYGEKGLRYKNIHLSQTYFAENHQGIIDSCLRYFALSARQAQQFWGDNLPPKIKTALESNPDLEFYFIHCVRPRTDDYDPTRKDFKAMKFVSYYVSIDEPKILSEQGYNTFPYAVARYEQVPGEVYGRSPAMDVLPAIKTLNEEKRVVLTQGHRAIAPVLLGHDDGVLDTASIRAGSFIAGGVNADGKAMIHQLPVGNISIGKELMDDERAVINDAFLVNLFQVLVDNPQMTATEVLERSREKGILVAPTTGRQQSEYLEPTIERELDRLGAQRMLPPMPQLLLEAQGEYKIIYDSPLSRAQRAEEASGIMRTFDMALQFFNISQDRAILDHFDIDTILPQIAAIQGVSPDWLRSKKQVELIRGNRAEQDQTNQAIQAAPGVAGLMKAGAAVQKA